VPIDDLRSLQSQLDVAQQALDDADRFGLALRERYASQAAQGTLEMEAFLRSEQQAHQQLDATLTQMAAVLRRHFTSAS
jgi:hypothetical protein